LWQESELPNGYQKLMDKFELNGRTLCNLNQAEEYSSSNETGSERDISAPRNYIMLGGEKYSIIGLVLLFVL
jgi:hypothetical protein